MASSTLQWAAVVVAGAGAAGTWGGLYFVGRTVISSRNIAQADFIVRTQTDFLANHSTTYAKFIPGRGEWAGDKDPHLTTREQAAVQHYLDFFNTLEILRSNELIDLPTLDRMFAYRFFVAAHSNLGAKAVEADKTYFRPVLQLYNEWVAYREEHDCLTHGLKICRYGGPALPRTKPAKRWEAAYAAIPAESTIGIMARLKRRASRRFPWHWPESQ